MEKAETEKEPQTRRSVTEAKKHSWESGLRVVLELSYLVRHPMENKKGSPPASSPIRQISSAMLLFLNH
ncbi:uncharacterized protein BO97DRAFT_403499 [Aspergillus homomorphus CBS 101889]|uniref:Uncharacterized protein n=1 Tax=Aspergillus homomorphus (strain CBS 101889) TaxID=1450537 RepID=A0A395I6P2_ASPHC|nr:hypothetical protein BO97DRAFT_403499 [Aspergillus homomorphus CBS 101889]RAL15516.1 hypothetical protein BO97DRAFT_403499 [Aspergillus homomorphus CBS 101889]